MKYKFDHIHYFDLYETVEFTYDGKTFKGMILDFGDQTNYFPQLSEYAPEVNLLNIYFGTKETEEAKAAMSKINGKEVDISIDGSYSEEVDDSENTTWEFFIDLISRLIVVIADQIQALLDPSASRKELLFTRQEIEENLNLNNQIQVANSGENREGRKVLNFKNTARNRQGETEEIYNADTKIPVIAIDPYWLVIGNFKLFDINFFNIKNQNTNAFREIIRNVVITCSRSMLYIAAALLLTVLIWRSVLLVKASFEGDPESMAKTRRILDSWVKGAMLVGLIYFIAIIIIYFYSYMVNVFTEGYNYNYLVRIDVNEVYSFNTNSIGFARYLSLTSNIYAKLGYSILYLVMTIINLSLWLGMFIRMLTIAGLTIIAPITAVEMAINGSTKSDDVRSVLSFKGWLMAYLISVFAPFIIILCQRLLIELL